MQYLRWARLLPTAIMNLQATTSITTSSFQLANLDCLLTGSPETKAIIRMIFYSLVLPAALFFCALLSILLVWGLGRFSITTRRWISEPTFQAKHRVIQSLGRALNTVVLAVGTFAGTAPELPPLKKFLKRRIIVSTVVLAFALYQPFTSTMLLILQCQRLGGPTPGEENYYNNAHTNWLQNYNSTTSAGLWGKPAPVWANDLVW